jgi:hypothetical protein
MTFRSGQVMAEKGMHIKAKYYIKLSKNAVNFSLICLV